MMEIIVAQHIYSNVTKEKSPFGKRGFQTLFYTRAALTDEDIAIIEDRAQYYTSDTNPKKYQYYLLSGGKAVISQIVPLSEPDEFGRSGRYLAHSLIVAARDFSRLGYCPLSIITPQHYSTSLDDIYNIGKFQNGDIPARRIQVFEDWQDRALQTARRLPKDKIIFLARLGWQAQDFKRQKNSIAFIGDYDDILRALEIIFLFTEPEQRQELSFETYSYGTNWTRSWPFWAWGAPQQGMIKSDIPLNLHTWSFPQVQFRSSLSPYEQWVISSVIPTGLENFIFEKDQAQILHHALTGSRLNPRLLEQIDPGFKNAFLQRNANQLVETVLSLLPQGLSGPLLVELRKFIELDLSLYFLMLQLEESTDRKVARLFYSLILENPSLVLSKADANAIRKVAEDSRLTALSAVLNIKSGKITPGELDQVSDDEYQEILPLLIDSGKTECHQLLSLIHLKTWCEFCSYRLKKGEIKQVLELISNYKTQVNLDPLVKVANFLDQGDIKTLEKWLRSYKGPAPELRAMVEANLESQGSVRKIMRNLIFGDEDK